MRGCAFVFAAHINWYRFFRSDAVSVGAKMAYFFRNCVILSASVDTALPLPTLGAMAAVRMEVEEDGDVDVADKSRGCSVSKQRRKKMVAASQIGMAKDR